MNNAKTLQWTMTLILLGAFGAGSAAAGNGESSPTATEAKITQEQAQKIALEQVPGGTIKESELEKEGGKLVWSFDIAKSGSTEVMDVDVDAETGKVLKVEKDD